MQSAVFGFSLALCEFGKNSDSVRSLPHHGKLTGLTDSLVGMLQKQGKFGKGSVSEALLKHPGRFRANLPHLRIRRAKNLNGPVLVHGPSSPVVRKIKVAVVSVFDVGCRQALYNGFDFGHLERRAGRRQFDCVSYRIFRGSSIIRQSKGVSKILRYAQAAQPSHPGRPVAHVGNGRIDPLRLFLAVGFEHFLSDPNGFGYVKISPIQSVGVMMG